jgi:RING-like zinc finger
MSAVASSDTTNCALHNTLTRPLFQLLLLSTHSLHSRSEAVFARFSRLMRSTQQLQLGSSSDVQPASRSTIDSLPVQPPGAGVWGADEECAICLGGYCAEDSLRRLSCDHRFHLECSEKCE